MRYRVVKTVTTPLSRFEPGAEIDTADIDGIVTAERWQELGLLEEIVAPTKAKAKRATPAAVDPLEHDPA